MFDIDLPWWTLPIVAVIGAPGFAFAGAMAWLALAIHIARKQRFSSGKVVLWCSIAIVVGAVTTPMLVILAGDGGLVRVITLVFVAGAVAFAVWATRR